MPAVAEVQFKATNSQQVVTAFKSVGTAAQDSSTKIQQNSNAMKTLGQGMKSSMGGIAQVGTAFATLSLSVVSTWRAYRDLGDAQLAVDRANTKLTKSEEKLNDLKKKAALLQKQSAKGGLEEQRRSIEIAKAKKALAEAEKKYGKNSLEAADARLKVAEAEKKGTDSGGKLAEVQKDIAIQEEVVANNTFAASEAQERYNDTQQDFYLSILPTALSGLSTLALSLNGIKNMFSGGGGLIGAIGPFGIALAVISAAILAFKTNFLGFRDVVMGVITFVREQFGAWQKTIQEVFGLIQQGDWGGAFARIAKAAQDFWNYLVTHVPFFGGLNKIIVALKNGDWQGVFNIVRDAAVKFWEDLKKQVPFFAGAQQFFEQLFAGDFSGAWKTLTTGITSAWAAVVKAVPLFGDIATFLRTKFELARDTAKNAMSQLARDIQPSITTIQEGLAKLGSGDIVGGFSKIGEGIKSALAVGTNALNNWTKTNFGIDIVQLQTQANSIGMKILDGISSGLTFVSTTFIDKAIVALFDPQTWISQGKAQAQAITQIGNALWNFVTGAFENATKGGGVEGALRGAKIALNVWNAIVTWMTANVPDTTKMLQAFAQSVSDAVGSTVEFFKKLGTNIWNGIIDGIKNAISALDPTGLIRGALETLKIKAPQIPPIAIPLTANTTPAKKEVEKFEASANRRIVKGPQIQGNTNPLMQATNKAIANIEKRKVHVNIYASPILPGGKNPRYVPGYLAHQHGYMGTVKRATPFIAGEGGRPEDVTITPHGSKGGRGGGGGDVYVGPIYLGGEKIIDIIRYKMTENSSIFR